MIDAPPIPEDDGLLAAELALGLLDDTERQAATARLDRDPVFARAHARWLDHAATLFGETEEAAAPRPEVWQAIAARLPANDDFPPRQDRRWQLATAASLALAAVIGVVAFNRPAPTPPAIVEAPEHVTMVAVLTGKDQGALAVTYDATARRLITAPAGLRIARGSAELWVIPDGHKPISLGVVPADGTRAGPASAQATRAMAAGVTLAISIEPVGGSPSGQPTGPVILTGKMTA